MITYQSGNQKSKRNGQVVTSILDIQCSSESIYVFPGSLSPNDIVLKYKYNNCRRRTPKHIHFTLDLLLKREHNPTLVNSLIDEFLQRWNTITPLTTRSYNSLLKNLKITNNSTLINNFIPLNQYGDYSVEFLITFAELLMIQEKTNNPNAYMFKNVLTHIKNNADIYTIVSLATHNGR